MVVIYCMHAFRLKFNFLVYVVHYLKYYSIIVHYLGYNIKSQSLRYYM